jgi:UDP-N-acetylmuramoylalanine--D-glutamate ligase
LSIFKGVEGRSKYYTINNCELLVGKTDNAHATKVALSEKYFEVVFLGTPRDNELWRLELFKEAINTKPKTIIIFPGLSNNVDNIYKKVLTINNNIKIIKVNELNNLFDLIKKMTHISKTIFIGGNGQDNIIKIQKMLDNYMRSDYCE